MKNKYVYNTGKKFPSLHVSYKSLQSRAKPYLPSVRLLFLIHQACETKNRRRRYKKTDKKGNRLTAASRKKRSNNICPRIRPTQEETCLSGGLAYRDRRERVEEDEKRFRRSCRRRKSEEVTSLVSVVAHRGRKWVLGWFELDAWYIEGHDPAGLHMPPNLRKSSPYLKPYSVSENERERTNFKISSSFVPLLSFPPLRLLLHPSFSFFLPFFIRSACEHTRAARYKARTRGSYNATETRYSLQEGSIGETCSR